MRFWKNKRVVVTGGAGFLGSVVVEKLRTRGCERIFVPRSREFDLREKEAIVRLLDYAQPHFILHLAAVAAGIGVSFRHPGQFFYDNAIMGIQLVEQARRSGVEKFVAVGPACSYPKHTPVPFREQSLWSGYPEETSAAYGLAKKMLLAELQAYRREYGFNGIYLLLANLYGPGGRYDPEALCVIPANICRCLAAKHSGELRIVAWGSGKASREFLHLDDAAEGILLAAEHYHSEEPVNLGSGEEITIRALVQLICELTGYTGEVDWDIGRPDGQPRRCLDTDQAEREFGFKARTSLREGLLQTIRWYEEVEAVGAARVATASGA